MTEMNSRLRRSRGYYRCAAKSTRFLFVVVVDLQAAVKGQAETKSSGNRVNRTRNSKSADVIKGRVKTTSPVGL